MASGEGSSSSAGKCPVYFCGTPQSLTGFSTLFSNAEKLPGIEAISVPALGQLFAKAKDVEQGVILLLIETKNDLVFTLNVLAAFKKKLDKGALRALAYSG